MNIELSREALLKPLGIAAGVIGRKQTMPIFANVLIEINQQHLSITGSDSEIEIIGQTTLTDGISQQAHRITVPGKKMLDICRSLPDNATISLAYEDADAFILRSGKSCFTLATLPANDFPITDVQPDEYTLTITQKQLKNLLRKTAFAMGLQDARYFLNGLLLELFPDKLELTGTDGHRLSKSSLQLTTSKQQSGRVIIPRKAVLELYRLLTEGEETVEIAINNSHIRIMASHFNFISKLIEGRAPNYDRVIPQQNDKIVNLDVELLKQALNRAAILCNEKFRSVQIELTKHLLKISANNPQQERAEEEITIEYPGEALDTAFNVGYLLDVLNTVDSQDVRLHFGDTNSAVLITETGQPATNQCDLFVVMPMHL